MKQAEPASKTTQQRRQVLAGMGILSLLAFWKVKFGFLSPGKKVIACAPGKPVKTMKLLSEDGRLVEVDISNIKSGGQKITDQQLQQWVKK